MLKEAIEYVLGFGEKSAEPILTIIAERQYANKKLEAMPEPMADTVHVSTLSGLVDLVKAKVSNLLPDDLFVLVASHEELRAVSLEVDAWGRRQTFAQAKLAEANGFRFGQFLDHDTFIIGLQAFFLPTDGQKYLLRLASNLTAERVTTSEDDGVGQVVGQKRGVALKTTEAIQPRVQLAPYRTFREIEQPASDFVLRLKQETEGAVPKLALFEADGGAWKIAAIANIARYLSVALDKIPVVS